MKLTLNIQQKIQLYIIFSIVLIFVFTLGYISINSRQRDIEEAKRIINLQAESTSNLLQDRINTDINVARNIRNSFKSWHKYPREIRDSIYLDMQKDILIANPEYISIATSWEYFQIDTAWQKPHGRVLWGWYRENGTIKELKLERHLEGDDINSTYYSLKTGKHELFNNPEPYSYTGKKDDAVLSTNISIPILTDGKFIGLVGIDVDQSRFQNIILTISPFENSYAFVLSSNLLFVAHPNASLLGKFVGDETIDIYSIPEIEKNIASGNSFTARIFDQYTQEDSYVSFYPISIDGMNNYWTLGISVPSSVIAKQANRDLWVSIVIGLIGIVIIILITWYISRHITIPVRRITSILKDISRGKINKEMYFNIKTGDEFEDMGVALNKSIDGLFDKTSFSQSIGTGNLNSDLELLSDEDILGKSLLDMRNNLSLAKNDENVRKIEDDKRNWATEGYAKFGEILRIENHNLEALSLKVLQNLVSYIGANQGGIFVLNEDEEGHNVLEMSACFAYDRQKFMEKKIQIGEGLIGSCYKEGKTIYLTEIPDTYVKISSGLGDENPKALLVVPLRINEKIYGIIELAAFEPFEKHKIEFVEKIGESIASTISNIKISIQTNELLKKSRKQAEEMKSQEEEMRQNMEELAATQEEMARKTSETEGIINALDASSFILEYDINGYVTNISDSYCKFLGISRNEAIGKHHAYKVDFSEEQKREYKRFWDDLKNGKIRKEHTKIIVNENVHHLMETYAPIYSTSGEVVKIFKIANDVTESKTAYEKFSLQNEELLNQIRSCQKQIEDLKIENQKLTNDLKNPKNK